MRQMQPLPTYADPAHADPLQLALENLELRQRVAELAALVLDAEERALRGRVVPFEGRSVVLHERTWARVRAAAVRVLGQPAESALRRASS